MRIYTDQINSAIIGMSMLMACTILPFKGEAAVISSAQNGDWNTALTSIGIVISAINDTKADGTGLNSGSTLLVGSRALQNTAKDAVENTLVCNFTITVNNKEPHVAVGLNPNDLVDSVNSADNGPGICHLSISPNTYTAIGTYKVTLLVQDVHGNTDDCAVDSNVAKSADSISQCIRAGLDVYLNTLGQVTLIPSPVDNGSSDNCSISGYALDITSFDCFDIGIHDVVLTIADPSGNMDSFSATVTVQDNENPSLTCPAKITQQADLGLAFGTVVVQSPTTGDNCGMASVMNSFNGTFNASGQYHLGTSIVVWTVVDVNENSSQCSMTVSIQDDTFPDQGCPDDISKSASLGACETYVNVPLPSPTGNDGIASAINDYNNTSDASDVYPADTTLVTWTVTYNSGSVSTCVQTVIVTDDEAPSIMSCPADTLITATLGECGINGSLIVLEQPVAMDPCGSMAISNDDPYYYAVGLTNVIWTISDGAGNETYCTQVIEIFDSEGPVITSCPSNISVDTDPGECGTSLSNVSLGNATANDPCGIMTISNNAPVIFPVGITIVTWTITDRNGNTTTCIQEVEVVDSEAPVIIECPVAATLTAELNECGIDNALVDLGTMNATDACGFLVITNDSPAYFPVGETIVIWTISDGFSNTTSCTQSVTITDSEAPIISACPADTVLAATAGECGIDGVLVTLEEPTANDPCGSITITNDTPAYYPVGYTDVIWTITDDAGNSVTCTQVIVVFDDYAPIVQTCPPDVSLNNDPGLCGGVYTYNPPTAMDSCSTVTITLIDGLASGSEFPVGITLNIFEISDVGGNTSLCSFTVEVIDNEAPVLTDSTEIIIMHIPGECSAQVNYTNPSVNDNCSGSTIVQTDGTGLSSGSIFPLGTTTLCYQATDTSGNITDYCFDIDVFDTQSPIVVSCPSDVTLISDPGICGAAYTVQEPVVIDNCGSTSMINDSPAIFPVGMTTVIWTISDEAGNTTLCAFQVNVFDEELPEIECPDDLTFVSAYNECEAYITIGAPVTSDNCGVFSFWNSFNTTADASGVYPLGATQATWHVSDIYGNESACIMTVTVETPGAPEIVCPNDITSGNDPGACGAEISVPTVFLENPCSIVSVTNDYKGTNDASTFYSVGETIVTWLVTDITGYSSMCQTTISVSDDEAPIIECPEDISASNDLGICDAYVPYSLPFVSDNCDVNVPILLEGPSPGALFNVGSTVVSYMVFDVNGNSAQCNFQVTVSDEEAPVITCPQDMNQTDSMVVYELPAYADNCSAELILIEGPTSESDFDHGYTQIVFAAVDLNGNMDTCSFQVLVNTPPLAENDTIIVFESNDILEIDIMDNDYDIDGDEIHISHILHGSALVQLDDSIIYYNIPDNFCGLDSVVYVLMDEYGATDTATVSIFVDCYPTVFVPEGFSPNGDGVNDVLYILGIRQYPNNELRIFNRWGHKVFERKDYQNDWNGMSEASMTIGETKLPRGTYYYVLDLHDSRIRPIKGFIYINPR